MSSTPISVRNWDVGNHVRLTATFKVKNVPTDPTVVRIKYKTPAGVTTTVTYPDALITKSGTGVYYFVIDLNAAGSWWYRWEGTGNVKAAIERRIQVKPTEF